MTGITAFTAMTDISSVYVEEAALPDAILADTVAAAQKPTRAERWESFRYFMNNGWVVAACCTIVAAAVLTFIIRAGRGTLPSEHGSHMTGTAAETETETAADTAPETEDNVHTAYAGNAEAQTWQVWPGLFGSSSGTPNPPIPHPQIPSVPDPKPKPPSTFPKFNTNPFYGSQDSKSGYWG